MSYLNNASRLLARSTAQGVTWIVMTEPTLMSELQLKEYRYSVALLSSSKVRARQQ